MTVIASFIPFLIVIALAYLSFRAATWKRRIAYADHYHWIVRSLAALIAVSALIATAIGTWRGSEVGGFARSTKVTVPTRPPRAIPESWSPKKVDLDQSKLIGTIIIARRLEDGFIPLSSESKVFDWKTNLQKELNFTTTWSGSDYWIKMRLDFFTRTNDSILLSENTLTIKAKGPGGHISGSGGNVISLDTLRSEQMHQYGRPKHPPLSLIPYANSEDICLLVHLTRADADDPLDEMPMEKWLQGQSTGSLPIQSMSSYQSIRHDPGTPPGLRLFAYAGPSALLLLLAAVCGSMCFRYGRRGPAFAGFTFAMVLYVGLLDAVVLHRRAGVMADPAKPETVRITAMSAMTGTFFHAKRAGTLIDTLLRDPKTADTLRGIATQNLTD